LVELDVRGLLDFRDADTGNRQWRRLLRIRLLGLTELKKQERAAKHHQHYCSMLASIDSTNSGYNDIYKAAVASLEDWEDAFVPDAAELRGAARAERAKANLNQWAAAWGNPDDPETQRSIDEAVKLLTS